MAHSLELRSPFLDHEVVELGVALPDSLKTQGREGKVALRRAFAADLPAEVARRGKTGFGVPLGRWFSTDLRETAQDLLSTDRGWFRPGAVRRLLDEHESGHTDHGHRLWCLLMLELWLREHVEAPVLVAAGA
jgi:asparagine synthase (glutamine-hydrolysing)